MCNNRPLNCPLCCTQTFDSPKSLKLHLLEILSNLSCPACSSKFTSLPTFLSHLDEECSKVKNSEPSAEAKKKARNSPFFGSTSAAAADLKVCNEEDPTIGGVLGDESNDSGSENVEVEVQAMYFCELCNTSIDCLESHIEQYHTDQEITLLQHTGDGLTDELSLGPEVASEELPATAPMDLNESALYAINQDDIVVSLANDDADALKSNNTISEDARIDKGGRQYVRKVVKIDRFWETEQNNEPLIQKYVTDMSGRLKRITKSEENQIEIKTNIVTLFVCRGCSKQFTDMTDFNSHTCNPNFLKKYVCTECQTEFRGANSIIAHMKQHKKPTARPLEIKTGTFRCDECGTDFTSFRSLRLHARMHNSLDAISIEPAQNDPGTFTCLTCNRTIAKEYEKAHMDAHSELEAGNFTCTVCNKKFSSSPDLDMHMKAHFNTSKKFSCSYCKKLFVSYPALETHLTSECKKRRYECQYCGRRFTKPHEKVKHERIHTGEKPYSCEICGKSFRVSYCLTLHMRTHTGVRPYHCEQCDKRFKSLSVYNHHLQIHSDDKKFQCPFCPKSFKTSVQLSGHKNSHIKPFRCTECNRPFASLYTVRLHMESHKRVNNLNFVCFVCGASYARGFALKDHIKEQHGVEGIEGSGALSDDEEISDSDNNEIIINVTSTSTTTSANAGTTSKRR